MIQTFSCFHIFIGSFKILYVNYLDFCLLKIRFGDSHPGSLTGFGFFGLFPPLLISLGLR